MDKKEDEKKQYQAAIPHSVFDSGLWAKMTNPERSIYGVLCRYRNFKTGWCFPSVATLSKMSGCNKNAVCKATKNLAAYGLIEKKRAPKGFKFRNVYKVLDDPRINLSIVPQTVDKRYAPSRKKDGKFGVIPQSVELDIVPHNVESTTVPQSVEKKESEVILSNNSFIRDTHSHIISKETIKEWEKVKGKKWVAIELKRKGYKSVILANK